MLRNSTLVGLALLSLSGSVFAQDVRDRGTSAAASQPTAERTYSGRVLDKNGQPMVSITVMLVTLNGQNVMGTYTDMDGNYRMTTTQEGPLRIRVTAVGFKTYEQNVASTSGTVNIALEEEGVGLDEIVVVGYRPQRAEEVTGSVARVSGERIAALPVQSAEQALAGRVSGVNIQLPNGRLNNPSRVRIRGTNSITQSGEPLYVIDGIPYAQGDFSQGQSSVQNPLSIINPADIETMTVLKDGASAAQYGSRASNGVIMITTKRGKAGATRVSYDMQIGFTETLKRLELLNAYQFVDIKNEMRANAGLTPIADLFTMPDGSIANTDWQNEVYQRGLQQQHTLAITGGNERTQYYLSLGYTDQEGILKTNRFRRGSLKLSVDHQATKWMKMGINSTVSRVYSDGLNTGTNSLSGSVLAAYRLWPNVPVRLNGDYYIDLVGNSIGQGNNTLAITNAWPNIAYVLDRNKSITDEWIMLTTAYLEVNPFQYMTVRGEISMNFNGIEDYTYWNPTHGDGRGFQGYVEQWWQPRYRYTSRVTANYTRPIGTDHKIGVLVGWETQLDDRKGFRGRATGLSDPAYDDIITGTFTTPLVQGFKLRNTFDSYFGTVDYNYQGKYIVAASLRNDGLSNLAPSVRRGTFYGFSVGWVLSSENFFPFKDLINQFKLRASYGRNGNAQGLGTYAYLGSYGAGQYGPNNGSAYNTAGNSQLTWETNDKYDVGFDMGLLDDRIRVTADYFRIINSGLILNIPAAPSAGLPSSISTNIGASMSEGFELSINGTVFQNGSWTYDMGLDLTFVESFVTSYPDLANPFPQSTLSIVKPGEYLGSFYTLRWGGVNPANGFGTWYNRFGQQIQYNQLQNPSVNGDEWLFMDGSAAPAPNLGIGATDDRVLAGQPNPKWFGGWNHTLRYGNWDLSALLRFSLGFQVYNETLRGSLLNLVNNNNGTVIMGRWTPDNRNTNIPRLSYSDPQTFQASTRWIENGDFLRIQNVTVGYTLPQRWVSKLSMTSMRLYISANNLALFTSYSGIDPEANSQGQANTGTGLDIVQAPQARTFLFGASVQF